MTEDWRDSCKRLAVEADHSYKVDLGVWGFNQQNDTNRYGAGHIMNWKVLLKMEGETLFKRTATMEFPSKEKELDSTPNASK